MHEAKRAAVGVCEICGRDPATRRAKFVASFLEGVTTPLEIEETLSQREFEKRVCDRCLNKLREMKNVHNLIFERL